MYSFRGPMQTGAYVRDVSGSWLCSSSGSVLGFVLGSSLGCIAAMSVLLSLEVAI